MKLALPKPCAWRGDIGELLDELEPQMCAFARAQGCTLIMGTGRKGWERVTRQRGYRFGLCHDGEAAIRR
jgi:hypothetical protein